MTVALSKVCVKSVIDVILQAIDVSQCDNTIFITEADQSQGSLLQLLLGID